MKKLMVALVSVAVLSASAGVTATWTGAVDSRWDNPQNWLVDGDVPAKAPGVIWDGVTGTPATPSGDTAVFGASTRTTIDLSNLYSIGDVQIKGADASYYVFGTDAAQVFPLEPGKCLYVEASVPQAPRFRRFSFQANLASAANFSSPSLFNDSSSPVVFESFGNVVWRPGATPGWKLAYVYFRGKGFFTFEGPIENLNSLSLGFNSNGFTGGLNVNSDIETYCKLISSGSSITVNIAEGKHLWMYPDHNTQGLGVYANAALTINGPGGFRLYDKYNATSLDNRGVTDVLSGGRLTVNAPFEVVPSSENWTAWPDPQWILKSANGIVTLGDGGTDIRGGVRFDASWYGEFRFSSQAAVSGLGGFVFGAAKNGGNAAKVIHAGDKDVLLDKPITVENTSDCAIVNEGTGVLTLASELKSTSPGDAAGLTLNASGGMIRYEYGLAGTVGPNLVFTGMKGIVVAAGAELPNKETLAWNADVTVEGGPRVLPPLKFLSNSCKLRFTDPVTNVLSGLQVTGGSLDVYTVPGGRVRVVGLDSLPANVKLNDRTARVTESGAIVYAATPVDIAIAARGDVVPNEPNKTVGIASAGMSGNDVLAADATTVKGLIQSVETPAVVEIGEGQFLTAGSISFDDGAGDLTLGTVAGRGALAPADTAQPLPLDVGEIGATLTVNAKLATDSVAKTGSGTTVFAGGATAAVRSLDVSEGTVALRGGIWQVDQGSAAAIRVHNGAKLVVDDAVVGRMDGAKTSSSDVAQIDVYGGVMEILGETTITGRVCMGKSAPNGTSAVYQRGGSVYDTGYTGKTFYPFDDYNNYGCGSGYWNLSGGTVEFGGAIGIGHNASQAIVNQSAGSFVDLEGTVRLGGGTKCLATFVMTGGSNTVSGLNLRDWGAYDNNRSTLTLDGPTAYFEVRDSVNVAFENNQSLASDSRAILNLCGGTFVANRVLRGGNDGGVKDRGISKGFVNFNGGTFRTRMDVGQDDDWYGGLFGSVAKTDANKWIDRVTVFAGGATIETDAAEREVYLENPLQKPFGKGVKSIAWRQPFGKLVSPPNVVVYGKGEGASAYAVFDAEKGEVTGIRVVASGWGYDETTTAKVFFGDMYSNTGVECDVELEDVDTTGGFTKSGEGTVVFDVANTYGGDTVLRGGTLRLQTPGAIPEGSLVDYCGGTLESTVAACPAALRVRLPESADVKRVRLVKFTDGVPAVAPSVEIVNQPTEDPWIVSLRGNVLKAARPIGMAIIVR